MSQKKLVIDQLKLMYEGPFDLNGLYRAIDSWLYEKGYERAEKRISELVQKPGKELDVEIIPYKATTDYYKNIIRIRIKGTGLRSAVLKVDGKEKKLNIGKLTIVFDGYLESDYEGKWESRPILFFFRTLLERYVFKNYYRTYEKWLINDVYELHARIQTFLNTYKFMMHKE